MMRCLRLAATCHVALSFFFSGVASADQNNAGTTSHDAHVHGEWELFAALDESRLTVTVSGPLIDALGFERAPSDDTEKAQAENVARALSDAANVISLTAPARCAEISSAVVYPWSSDIHRDDRDEHLEDCHVAEEKEHVGEDDHHDINVEVEYVFDCASPRRLSEIHARLFAALPSVEKVRAVYISETIQTEKALTEKSPVMRLK